MNISKNGRTISSKHTQNHCHVAQKPCFDRRFFKKWVFFGMLYYHCAHFAENWEEK